MMGSSPRIRGKRTFLVEQSTRVRLIPAHTGKTETSSTGYLRRRAHPRAYGENKGAFAKSLAKSGSSPRIRGKLIGSVGATTVAGLIPAHTGKTLRIFQPR